MLAVTAGAALGSALPRTGRAASVAEPSGGWNFLTMEEAGLLAAVCEQIVPADQDPGAMQAGCVDFIDRQLAGTYRRHQRAYREGLAALQELSRRLHGRPFEELPFDIQTAVLVQVEAGRVDPGQWTSRDIPSPAFFQLVRNHTLQGFYGSPRHGGNKGFASYRMLGIELPRFEAGAPAPQR